MGGLRLIARCAGVLSALLAGRLGYVKNLKMKYKSLELLRQLKKQTRDHLDFVTSLKMMPEEELNRRPVDGAWNILECLQHLNLYGEFYLGEISGRMARSDSKPAVDFKSGPLGNYFARSILPRDKTKKMKTFREMDPIYAGLTADVIDVFLDQQENLLRLLEQAESKDLNRIRIRLSFSRLFRLRLGDMLRFLVNHNVRHIVQIRNILSSRSRAGSYH